MCVCAAALFALLRRFGRKSPAETASRLTDRPLVTRFLPTQTSGEENVHFLEMIVCAAGRRPPARRALTAQTLSPACQMSCPKALLLWWWVNCVNIKIGRLPALCCSLSIHFQRWTSYWRLATVSRCLIEMWKSSKLLRSLCFHPLSICLHCEIWSDTRIM